MTLLGASNSWFPITLSAISLPEGESKLRQLVDDHWAKLQKVRSQDSLEDAIEMGSFPNLVGFPPAEIWGAIEAKHSGGENGETAEDLKTPEWHALSNPSSQPHSRDFRLREVDPPTGFEEWIEKTVLVERLREVRALLSFTRIESPGDFADGIEIPDERRAPLSREASVWLPASEVRGEGLFLEFRKDALAKWRKQATVKERERDLWQAHSEWREMRNIEQPGLGFPGIVYVALHSLAHCLMRQFSLECGYTAASIRERVYVKESDDPSETMAGFLIYTAAPDSEGTLGGLVALGKPDELGSHLARALEQSKICTSDPLCAENDPANGMTVHGAACHGCLFVPETSCERGNKYLDRSTLVDTYAFEDLGLFGKLGDND